MKEFNFDEAVELALRTWYPKDHDLHMNPHHPLGKLEGEWGELMEDQMKLHYKPNYESETEKELGDIWYYIRILAYQENHKLTIVSLENFKTIEYLISGATKDISQAFMDLEDYGFYNGSVLDISYSTLLEIAGRFDLTLDQLTASNWQKLKPGSERGDQWAKARRVK